MIVLDYDEQYGLVLRMRDQVYIILLTYGSKGNKKKRERKKRRRNEAKEARKMIDNRAAGIDKLVPLSQVN